MPSVFFGDFETHLTVAAGCDHDRLAAWAAERGLKYARIVLDRGREPDQPMLTLRGRGSLADQRVVAGQAVAAVEAQGFAVVRVKIEASPFSQGVPQTAEAAAELPPECYFEHHVKLALADEGSVELVRSVCAGHTAHVSRNARRVVAGGHERFVTQRCRAVGLAEAGRRLDALLAALAGSGFQPVEVEREFVVADSHLGLDAGWLE